ncbi:MAG: 50S ribosomal protein L21 [Bradymonadales bacterium]|nr:MAG: 50S ribosomal protein L21 [Bradymonadales bacterium]
MFAVFEAMGRQYKVSVGDVIHIDRISDESKAELQPGSELEFNQVLMIGEPDSTENSKLGKPFLEGALVLAELVDNDKDAKVIAFKKKRRKGYRKKIGHRRQFSSVVIKEIKAA